MFFFTVNAGFVILKSPSSGIIYSDLYLFFFILPLSQTTPTLQTLDMFTINNTYEVTDTSYDSTPTWVIVCATVMIILTIVGVVGNGAVVFVVLWHQSMRNTPNALVACLAFGDLMFLFTSAPFKIYHSLFANWPFGKLMCKIANGVNIITLSVSVLSLTALSYDRFKAIVTPMNYTQCNSSRITYGIIVLIWIVSIDLAVPTIIWSKTEDWGHGYYGCIFLDHHSTSAIIYESVRCLILYVLPLLIITVFYVMVSRKLIRSTRAMLGEVHDKSSQISSRKRLAGIVLAIVILFAICWLPATVCNLLFQVHPSVFFNMPMVYFRLAANMMSYANSSLNPILLSIVSSNYRQYIGKCLCALRSGKKRLKKTRRSATFSSKVSSGSGPLSVRTKVTEFAT